MNDVRWKQRFANYNKALEKLQDAIDAYQEDTSDEIVQVGMIKFFEMVYELAWNTIKDYYEDQGEANIQGSKDAIKLAFSRGLIKNATGWYDMVSDRRLSVHTYNQITADEVAKKILTVYADLFIQLQTRLQIENLRSE